MINISYSLRSSYIKFLLFFFVTFFIKTNSYSQVNQQSGSATFSLPMFNWQDDKSRLNSVVALNYSSGNGLKVNDVASNVGQGWNLVAGGVITRMQIGEPDDQIGKDGLTNDITKYPPGYLYAANDASLGCLKAITNYPIYQEKNRLYKQHNIVVEDKELDYFSFQFNGRSGLFVLDKASFKNNTYTGVSIGDSKLKISFAVDPNMLYLGKKIRTSITSFQIQDENGLIYKFARHGLTKILKTNYCDANLVSSLTQPDFKKTSIGNVYHEAMFDAGGGADPYVINGWYLTEIQDALVKMSDGATPRKISINYAVNDLNINSTAGVDITYYQENNYTILSHKTSITFTPQISSISYPDGHKVFFNYGNARVDLIGDNVLASVDVQYQNRYLSKYQLNTSYFILNRYGTPVRPHEKESARLCLLSIKKFGVDLKAEDQPYLFDYYLNSDTKTIPDPDDFIPPPFFHLKDIFGFYNGNFNKPYSQNTFPAPYKDILVTDPLSSLNNNQLKGLCYLNESSSSIVINPKTGYAKSGLLKQIIYPTGGTLRYNYDQNTGVMPGATTAREVGGVHVSETRVTDGGYSNGCDNPLVTQYSYLLESQQPSLWGLEVPNNAMVMNSHYEAKTNIWFFKFPAVSCTKRFKYPGILSVESAVNLSGWQETKIAMANVAGVVSGVLEVIHIASLAATGTGWGAIVIDLIGNLLDIVFGCLLPQTKDNTITVYYNSDLNSANPLPAQFKRVVVTPNTGGIGKTVNVFTSDDDYPVWALTNGIYSMKQRYANWAYGLPKLTTVYDNTGINKVQEKEYLYDYDNAKTKNVLAYPSCKYQLRKNYSQPNTEWENPDLNSFVTDMSNDDVKVEIYNIITGHLELKETNERTYNMSNPGQFAETKTQYEYNALYLPSKITTTESNGDKRQTEIRYTGETYLISESNYPSPGVTFYYPKLASTLKSNNILSIPYDTYSSIIKNGQTFFLNEKVTEFTTLANGDIKPLRILEQRFNTPQTSFIIYGSEDYPKNPLYREIQSFIYDRNGNLIGMKDEGNHVVSNIYDYNDKYLVASVINANPLIDKPAYTSFETAAYYGGWTLTGPETRNSSSAVTGSTSLNLLSSNTLSTPLNSAKSYKVSFWSTSALVVSVGTLANSAPSINGFTYYEYNVPGGNTAVTVSGTATIDELRVYPASSRMRTIAYDPLIGKTAECDENNRITYYEYDELARLRFIKDENKNIVKMYEYNYAKQNGCPSTYSNNAITEVFQKNNCNPGYPDYVGSTITYTIPAGKYTSTISQADVDQKVQNELNTYGQAYANSGLSYPNTIGVGTCIRVYYNVAKSQTFTKENCPDGYTAGTTSYSVPAGKYSSTVDQATADQFALDEIKANGQAFANNDPGVGCVMDVTPSWQAEEPASTRCQQDANGNFTGHKEVYMKNVNPNSGSTYNTWQWIDVGENTSECPATTTAVYARISYENIYSQGTQTYGDVVVQLYSDAAGTQPVSVNNLTVNFYSACSCSGNATCGTDIQYSQMVSGTYGIVRSATLLSDNTSFYSCHTNYTLNPGSGYTILY